jgi:hypothetical protein
VKVLITGSREWRDRWAVEDVLNRLLRRYGVFTLIEGEARGADKLSGVWAARHLPEDSLVKVPVTPQEWDLHGNGAGHKRNQRMVNMGPDMVLVFALACTSSRCRRPEEHATHGTEGCVAMARKANIPVFFCPQGLRW